MEGSLRWTVQINTRTCAQRATATAFLSNKEEEKIAGLMKSRGYPSLTRPIWRFFIVPTMFGGVMHSCRHLSPRRPEPDRQTSSECFSSPVSTPALDFPPHAKRRRSGPSPPFLVRSPEMALVSFVGRVLFASVFLISAYQEFIGFGDDGGHAAKELKAKFDIVSKHIHAHLGFQMPELEMKLVVASGINIKAFGGLLFIFGNPLGANLLALHLAISTPIAFDFYSYGVDEPEFLQLFAKFVENLALFGALLFFLGMKNSAPRTASKRSPKTKTA